MDVTERSKQTAKPNDNFLEPKPNSIPSDFPAGRAVQPVLTTTEGTTFACACMGVCNMHRNAFRPQFARNNATVRPSNFDNMLSKDLYCLWIPQQIS